jgi:hypothetical protein
MTRPMFLTRGRKACSGFGCNFRLKMVQREEVAKLSAFRSNENGLVTFIQWICGKNNQNDDFELQNPVDDRS